MGHSPRVPGGSQTRVCGAGGAAATSHRSLAGFAVGAVLSAGINGLFPAPA